MVSAATRRSPRTIFITGATAGIGEALARTDHARGERVIASGRDAAALAQLAATLPGLVTLTMDVADLASIESGAAWLAEQYPALDTVINNAGMQQLLDFTASPPPSAAAIDAELDINLRGLIHVSRTLLPLLRRQPAARLINVSSGLAYVPLARAPVYSASKAAVRAFTRCLRHQLAGTTVRVIELLPPLVETRLHRRQPQRAAGAMPLERFTAKALKAIDGGGLELPIGLAAVLRVTHRIFPALFFEIVNKPLPRHAP